MLKLIARLMMLALTLFVVGCEAAPTAVPPPPTRPLRTLVPTATNVPTASPTLLPTVTPTAAPTNTPTIAPTNTLTPTVAPTNAPAPTRTVVVAPGLYVSDVRVQPSPAPRGEDLTFYATFVNATNATQTYRWLVYIFKSDNRTKSIAETTRTETSIPVSASEQKSLGSWKLGVGGPCEDFVIRVGFFDQDNKSVNFMKPDGQLFEKELRVCPASEIPTPLPPTATRTPVGPTPTPVIPPGLYVVNLDISPDPAPHQTDLSFTVTFANITGRLQNFKWLVFIYKSDNPTRSYSETTAVTTSIPIAATDHKSLGYWKLGATGNQCDPFVARVAFFDQENKTVFFTSPDGKVFEKPFSVCN
ncbi:MAG: hypothetical protein HY868_25180 [Chloroflexi bacterium]|nr:hypothetical protein [Chloroflexota bacterium]